MNRLSIVIISLIMLASVTGCAPVISKSLLQQVNPDVTFETAFDNPEAVRDTTILWGGEIVSTRNLKEGTLVEVLQKPLDTGKKPKQGDNSRGRFLALYDGFLDGEVYAKGRVVTIAGVVKGRRVQLLDEIEYNYPLIELKEIHLWEPPSREPSFYQPPYYYWPYRYYW